MWFDDSYRNSARPFSSVLPTVLQPWGTKWTVMRPLQIFCSNPFGMAMAALPIPATNDLWPWDSLPVNTGGINGPPDQYLCSLLWTLCIDHMHWACIIMILAPRRKAQQPMVKKTYASGFVLSPSHLLTQFTWKACSMSRMVVWGWF